MHTIYFRFICLELKRTLSPLSNFTDVDPMHTMKLIADAYPVAYQTLYEAKPITCSVTNTTFEAVPAPCAVILDVSPPM